MNWEQHFRQVSRRPKAHVVAFGEDDYGFGGTLLAENLVALNKYFHETPAKTDRARQLQSDWSRWWIETGDPDNYVFLVPDEVWDEARNRRLEFNLANATTPAETEGVLRVAKTGMTTEQTRGEPDRRDPTTGQFFVPPEPILPKWVLPTALILTAVLVVGPVVVKKFLPIP